MKNIYKTFIPLIFNSSFLIFAISIPLDCFSQWTSLNSGTSNFLFNVNFPSNDTGYIVQDNGFLRNSIDGGQSWTFVNSNELVYDISFITNDTGWAISNNEILKTKNGGAVWNSSYLDLNAQFYWKIYTLNSNSIYAIGINNNYDSAVVTRSIDGGITWIRSTFLEDFGIPNAISFPQPAIGYIADMSENIYKSIDSGLTWNIIYSDLISSYNSVYFTSPDTGFIMSTTIQMTTDGGITWNIPNTNGINTAWYDMKFINSMTGFVVGGDGISSGSILKTTDGGFNWDLDTSNVQTFNAIYLTQSNKGFTCGTAGVLLKYDGGLTTQPQNLIPDPGFEDTASVFCGIYLPSDFNSTLNSWITPTNGTPDVFSTQILQFCWNYQPNSTYTGPVCILGSQLPRTGAVFVGLHPYSIPGLNQREYIQSILTTPMIPGHEYCVEFYVSLADHAEKYISTLGAYFSDSPVSSNNDQPLPYIPQIASSAFITDTAAWTKISGTLLATSAFNYITIGNFNDDASTSTGLNPGGSSSPGCYGSYYFIDDVSVTDCTTGIDEQEKNNSVVVFPNPAHEFIVISAQFKVEDEITVIDMLGKTIFRKTVESPISNFQLQTSNFPNGIYFVKINNGEKVYGRKMVVSH
jgi:photosystem II stability/assembly factor-like uncharacterized protein